MESVDCLGFTVSRLQLKAGRGTIRSLALFESQASGKPTCGNRLLCILNFDILNVKLSANTNSFLKCANHERN